MPAVAALLHAFRFVPDWRIDDVMVFNALGREEIFKIIDNALDGLMKRLNTMKFTLSLTEEAKEFVAEKGYDPQFGARPLKRAIQEHLLDPLAMKLLAGEFKSGERIKVLASNGELSFSKK